MDFNNHASINNAVKNNNNNGSNNNIQSNNKANNFNNFHFLRNEQTLLRKRNRLNSFEAFFGIELDNLGHNHKKSIDENDFFNSFCKEIKFDFQEEELENVDELLKSNFLINKNKQ